MKNSDLLFLGWQDTKSIYEILLSSDLGCFPGTHSVLWEQSAGVGLPCIFKKWEGIEHIDLGGNCVLMEKVDPQSLKKEIEMIYNNPKLYSKMKSVSEEQGIKNFSYSEIAKKAIEL